MALGKLTGNQYARGLCMLLLFMILLGCRPATPDSGQALASKIQTVEIQAETPIVVTTGAEQVPNAAITPSAESDPYPTAPVVPDPDLMSTSTHIPIEPIEAVSYTHLTLPTTPYV